jgi:hypothetical protein
MLNAHYPINRRKLLQSAAAGAATGLWGFGGKLSLSAETSAAVKITEPFHGAVLNHRHGKQTQDALTIRVSGQCRPGDRVTVNGTACRVAGERFEGEVALRTPETDLVAIAEGGGNRNEHRVRVVWDRYSEPRYRFTIDDNSFFLRDIAQKNYKSLFDCFYLKMLRDMHVKYATKFSLNIYYVAADDAKFPTDSDFRLPQFPDRYQGEFRDNADWLKLTFHAHANMPDRPYQDAPPQKLIADLDLVADEIRRFAGEETYVPPTVIHWAMTRQSALKPLYQRGVRVLGGGFYKNDGRWDINYNWNDEVSEYVSRHNAWKDFESGIVFMLNCICCNLTPVDRTPAVLQSRIDDPNTAEIIDIVTHEQYFWPFYFHYIPDHAQRIETTIRWLTERGYKPIFYHDGFLGGRAWTA